MMVYAGDLTTRFGVIPPLSVALMVKVDVPWELGVPMMVPDVFMLSPAGRLPDPMEYWTGGTPPVVTTV